MNRPASRPVDDASPTAPPSKRRTRVLALVALGVVFGDIGTSPLYAVREAFSGPFAVDLTAGNVLGVLSLVTWSLILVISVKYLGFVLRADNKGEGGILALMALIHPAHRATRPGSARGVKVPLILGGLFGAALLYGDGMLTPAISVLSAIEGLSVATPVFEPLVVPITIGILVGLFLVQRHGTGGVGAVFGPVTLIWFLVLATLGVRGILLQPHVLGAVNPLHAVRFFLANGVTGTVVLGAVFLVVTGGEALYADLGHFGPGPIRIAWFSVVLPALLLNYFGQGALILDDPGAAVAPFYLLAPRWFLYPLVGLATAATVIASQAIITGAFSLTMQAVRLGYVPRLQIRHTSAHERGQIYMPEVNFALMIGTIFLVLLFRSSSGLAGAYGLAVSMTMVITTLLFAFAAREIWGWSKRRVVPLVAFFLVVDLAFLAANVPKIPEGGWFPLVVAALVMIIFTTWQKGRGILAGLMARQRVPLDGFLSELGAHPVHRVPGTAVFPTGNPGVAPPALQRVLRHLKVLHERVIILTVRVEEVAYVDPDKRLDVHDLGNGFHRVVARYGFMEQPDVPSVLEQSMSAGVPFQPEDTTYFLGREWLIPTRMPSGMAFWRERLFALLTRNAQSATAYFGIPEDRVVEVGSQVRLEVAGAAGPRRPPATH